MNTVHLIFDTQEIDVDRNILLQFDYFRSLLEISPDNIKMNNVDVKLFIFLIQMLETKNLVKKIANLSDFLGHDGGCDSLVDYKCKITNCNKISLNKTFCIIHGCAVEGCISGDEYHKYCSKHKCENKNCENQSIGNKSCIMHKCKADGCDNLGVNVYCAQHKCLYGICENMCLFSNYCNDHGCAVPYCRYHSIESSKFCGMHKCCIDQCINERMKEFIVCEFHYIN